MFPIPAASRQPRTAVRWWLCALLLPGVLPGCSQDCPAGSTRWADGLCHLPTETADDDDDDDPVDFVLSEEPYTCADPSLRESQGPMVATDGGAEFQAAAVVDNFEQIYTGYGMAVADLNGDGVLDLMLPNQGLDQLFLGVGDGTFLDASQQLPQVEAPSTAATAVDVDGDGDLDLFISRLVEHNELLINDGGGHFVASSERTWLEASERTTMGSSWHDVDGDGDLDALVNHLSNWDPGWLENTPTEGLQSWPRDMLFWNEGETRLVAGTELPEDLASGFTFAAMWFDLDGTGAPGLYVANDYRVEFDWIQSNRVFRYLADSFEEISESSRAGLTSETMGLSVNDLNGDGRADLAMSARGRVHLLLSSEEGWYDVSTSAGLTWSDIEADFNAWGVDLEDIDNDGDVDMALGMGLLMADLPWDVTLTPEIIEEGGLFFLNPIQQADVLYLQSADGSFQNVAPEWGVDDDMITRGVVLADLNRDGWLDLLKRDMAGPPRIYMARCGAESSMSLRLEGPAPNPFGVGARVQVQAGDLDMTRWLHAGESLSSSAPYSVHFGLGESERIDVLTVRWPDGVESVFEGIATNQHLVLRHPEAAER
jgi:enediyne biosynthesis protein E4